MSKKNIKRIVISGIIIVITLFISLYIYTYTEYYARNEINKNLDANGIKATMNTEELVALDLGKYEVDEDKYILGYSFKDANTYVDIMYYTDRIWRIELSNKGQSLYDIIVGETNYEDAIKMFKKQGFFCPFKDDQRYLVKGWQSIRISTNKDLTVSTIDVRIEFNMPRIYFFFVERIRSNFE